MPAWASAVQTSWSRLREKTPDRLARAAAVDRGTRERPQDTGSARTPSAASVQWSGLPGRNVQPATSSSEQARAERGSAAGCRRSSSAPMSGSGFRSMPRAVRTFGKSQPAICQSPAHPAVLAQRVREHRRRVVVDDLEVGDERAAGEEALEEVVREQRVLGHPARRARSRTRRRRRGPCRCRCLPRRDPDRCPRRRSCTDRRRCGPRTSSRRSIRPRSTS